MRGNGIGTLLDGIGVDGGRRQGVLAKCCRAVHENLRVTPAMQPGITHTSAQFRRLPGAARRGRDYVTANKNAMREVATISFRDLANDDDACAIVRVAEGQVALCLTLKSSGDVEVFLSVQDTRRLTAALDRAVADASEVPREPHT